CVKGNILTSGQCFVYDKCGRRNLQFLQLFANLTSSINSSSRRINFKNNMVCTYFISFVNRSSNKCFQSSFYFIFDRNDKDKLFLFSSSFACTSSDQLTDSKQNKIMDIKMKKEFLNLNKISSPCPFDSAYSIDKSIV